MYAHLTNIDATRILRSRLGMRGPFSINDEDYARMVHTAMMNESRAIRECYARLLTTLVADGEASLIAVQEEYPAVVCAEPSESDFIMALLNLPPALRCISAAIALIKS